MKITRSLVIALVSMFVLVMSVNTVLHVQRERTLLDQDMRRDHTLIGQVLRATFQTDWSAQGEEKAEQLIVQINQVDPALNVRVVHVNDASGAHAPYVRASAQQAAGTGQEIAVLKHGVRHTYIPLTLPEAQHTHALELSEDTTPYDQHVHESVVRNVWIMGIVVVAAGVLASILGYRIVGRRMGMLMQHAQRVGEGDLNVRVEIPGSDEIAELGKSMNVMSEHLAQARTDAEEQSRARIEAVKQLRHAERLRTVGQLASGLAHELGTPLNVVLARASLVLDGDTLGEAQEHASVIREQARRMTALLRQLMDFARQKGPSVERKDLAEPVDQALRLLETMFRDKQAVLEWSRPPQAVHVAIDPIQIQQLVTNLVVNALYALRDQGTVRVHVGVEYEAPPAGHSSHAGHWGFVRVTDTGCGMEPATLDRVFEPFFTTKDVGEGTGLGLSVAYGIARDHGGWLNAESTLGEGSVFTLWLPLAPAKRVEDTFNASSNG